MLPCDGKESVLLTVLAPPLSTGLFCIRVTLYVSLIAGGARLKPDQEQQSFLKGVA